MMQRPTRNAQAKTLFPCTTLFRSDAFIGHRRFVVETGQGIALDLLAQKLLLVIDIGGAGVEVFEDAVGFREDAPEVLRHLLGKSDLALRGGDEAGERGLELGEREVDAPLDRATGRAVEDERDRSDDER